MNCPICGRFCSFENDCEWICHDEHSLPPRIYLNYPYPDEKEKLARIKEEIRKEKDANKP